jgi:hypothetical protein
MLLFVHSDISILLSKPSSGKTNGNISEIKIGNDILEDRIVEDGIVEQVW